MKLDRFDKIACTLVSLVVATCLVIILYTNKALSQEEESITKIQVFNPYSIFLKLEVKCDWQGDKRTYRFYREITIPKKGNATIDTPSNLHACQIWPKEVKFF